MTEPVPELLWSPSAELRERSEMAELARAVGARDYDELWRWSVDDVERFWGTIWDRYAIQADGDPTRVLASHAMPGARWFPDVRLSYPEHLLAHGDDDAVAIHAASELRDDVQVTWGELREQVRRIRAGLRGMGVGRGDRVAACLPNIPETVAAFLAATSLGAIWSCCSPDFGARTVVDRFAQIEPTVLLAVDGYRYGGRDFDRTALVDEIAAALPTLRHRVTLGYLDPARDTWDEAFPPTDEPLAFERVPFDHPLWILYSSGTTGTPKAIVHGHGGPLLEAIKSWRLHHAVTPGDRAMWFTTTGWMMWNYLVGALLVPGVRIVLYDGSPGHPDMGVLWDLVARTRATLFGTGAAYLHGCMHAGVEPREGRDLSALRAMGSTGSPLSPAGFRWVADHVGDDVWLASVSGGTDVVSAFVCGAPLVPVHLGELPARALGASVEAWDEDGKRVIDAVGELVLTRPLPSMPVGFWGDDDGSRYRDAYFAHYPGVWRQGDWITITPRGSAVIHGRSDATINRAGIRIGTAEIYNAVLGVPGIGDALAVDVPDPDGVGDGWLGLFVVLDDGVALDDALTAEVRRRVRSDCSPRHVPDELIVAPAVPRTLTGKSLEVPVKRMLMGHGPERVANVDALANPDAFAWFAAFARERVAA